MSEETTNCELCNAPINRDDRVGMVWTEDKRNSFQVCGGCFDKYKDGLPDDAIPQTAISEDE